MINNLWIGINIAYIILLTTFLLNLFIKIKFKEAINITASFISLGLNYIVILVILFTDTLSYIGNTLLFIIATFLMITYTYISINNIQLKKSMKINMFGNILVFIFSSAITIFLVIKKYFM